MAKQDKDIAVVTDPFTLDVTVGPAAAPVTAVAKPTKVRAKMRVERIEPTPQGGAFIHLRPVTSGSLENHKFYENTPGGACSIGLVSKEVARMFVLNQDYYVDFTPT